MSDSTMESTDWILGELESLARKADPDNVFYRRLIQALLPVLQCDCVLLAIQLESKPLVLDRVGELKDTNSIRDGLTRAFMDPKAQSSPGGSSKNADSWISARFPRNNSEMPMALLARFDRESTPAQLAGAKNLLDAFVEVCEVREVYVENARAVGLFKEVLARSKDFSNARSHQQLHRALVESIREALHADRVSLYVQQPQAASMVACSGVATIDPNASEVKELQSTVGQLLLHNQPKLWAASEMEREAQSYRLFLPWPSGSQPVQHGVLAEWSDSQAIIDRVQRASNLLPVLNQAWQNQNRWLYLPVNIQQQALNKAELSPRPNWVPKRILGLASLAAIGFLGLIPYPFYIQAEAYLEPVDQRFVHTTADSFIQELFVKEGQAVEGNQPLVQLRSPSLELQIEEADGQLRALEEKKNGLRIAVNQLTSNASDQANQTRLSAELKLVEIQERQAFEKGKFLRQQQADLLLASPIQGIVVGGDLQRELSDRPLQRGDVLFRIADMQGPWQLRLLIADRDGGYVQKALGAGSLQIDWGLENSPQQGMSATLVSLTNEVDQRPLNGPCRTAIANVDIQQFQQPVIGAVGYARIPCGKQPLWFVWSRPMVEFLQKRFWITANPKLTSTVD